MTSPALNIACRSERDFYLGREPDEYWINTFAARKNAAIDTSSVHECLSEAEKDASRPSADYQYLYTLHVARADAGLARAVTLHNLTR